MKWVLIIWMFDGSINAVPTQFGDPFNSLYECNQSLTVWIETKSRARQYPNSGECIPARFLK